ncbi:Ig-like domain-containing protein, partial [Candidatus Margulisiibacteriota bacterium]
AALKGAADTTASVYTVYSNTKHYITAFSYAIEDFQMVYSNGVQATATTAKLNAPTTPNAIYPTDNLTSVPAQPSYNLCFYTTENLTHYPVMVDIYFGEEGESLSLVTINMYTWPTADYTGFDVGTINRGTTYNWRVVAKNANAPVEQVSGPTWSFTTQYAGEVDHFEDGIVTTNPAWWTYGSVATCSITTNAAEGTYAITVTGSANDYPVGGTGITYWQDVSTYNYLALYLKNDRSRPSKIGLQLKEDDGDEWSYEFEVDWSGWAQLNVPLSAFSYAGGGGDGVWTPDGGMGTVPQVKLNLGYASDAFALGFNEEIGYSVDKLRFSQSGSLSDSQPWVMSVVPSGNNSWAPLGTTIRITFSEEMNKASVESAFIISPNITGTVSWLGNTMIFTPVGDLQASTTYTLSLNTSTVIDADGQSLVGNSSWQFNTSGGGTGFNPEVVNWSPRGDNTALNPTIITVFSEGMNRISVEAGFVFSGGAGSFFWIDDKTLAFFPSSGLAVSTVYSVTINCVISSLSNIIVSIFFILLTSFYRSTANLPRAIT